MWKIEVDEHASSQPQGDGSSCSFYISDQLSANAYGQGVNFKITLFRQTYTVSQIVSTVKVGLVNKKPKTFVLGCLEVKIYVNLIRQNSPCKSLETGPLFCADIVTVSKFMVLSISFRLCFIYKRKSRKFRHFRIYFGFRRKKCENCKAICNNPVVCRQVLSKSQNTNYKKTVFRSKAQTRLIILIAPI
jgi:hypothetical protein